MAFKAFFGMVLIVYILVKGEGTIFMYYPVSQPINDCYTENIDLLLVADASELSRRNREDDFYKMQLQLFSQFVDIFVTPSETSLARIRVSLVAFTEGNTTYSFMLDTRIGFDSYNNTRELKTAIESDEFPTFSESLHTESLMSIRRTIFTDTVHGAREDSQYVTITVIGGLRPSKRNIHDKNATDDMNIRAFNIFENELTFTSMMVPNSDGNMIVTTVNDTNIINYIILDICGRCPKSWFPVKSEEPQSSFSKLTCYRVFRAKADLSWLEANETCVEYASKLVSIETKEELLLLRMGLIGVFNLLKNRFNVTLHDTLGGIYVGLKRSHSKKGERFRWINKMPLIYTNWADGQPKGGRVAGCAVWILHVQTGGVLKEQSQASQYVNLSRKTTDGWYSVGCGLPMTRYFICETVQSRRQERDAPVITLELKKPDPDSFFRAVQRGEVFYHRQIGKLLSVSDILQRASSASAWPNSYAYANHENNEMVTLDTVKLFSCTSGDGPKIPYSLVCNHEENCPNGIDEAVCKVCDIRSEFRCSSNQCIPSDARCDLHQDCMDGSDEEDCDLCPHERCPSGRCMPKHWFGDGEMDCDVCEENESIEHEMTYARDPNITQCLFTCNRTQCVFKSMLNNNFIDCQGPEGPIDETIGALESTVCYSDSNNMKTAYANWAPKCVYVKDIYNEPLGCRDMSHLQDCEDFECPDGYVKCPRSYCIPAHYILNKEYDCAHGEDENNVSLSLHCNGYFKCLHHPECLHPDLVCDGHQQCSDGYDELNCNVTCRSGFVCIAGTVTPGSYDRFAPLTDLTFVDPSTRYLDLSGLDVSAVFPNLPQGHAINLIHAKLSGCNITSVEMNITICFDVRALLMIDLSYNLIPNITATNIFQCMLHLQQLNLSHNHLLNSIHDLAFYSLVQSSSIQDLDVSFTALSSLSFSVFQFLPRLKILSLRGTCITKLSFPDKFSLAELDLRATDMWPSQNPDMFRNVTITAHLYTDSFRLCCPQLHNPQTKQDICETKRDPFSSCFNLMSSTPLRLFLWAGGVMALSGNIGVVVYRLFFDRRIFQMAYGHFVTQLSISDLLMGVYLVIIAAVDFANREIYVWTEQAWRSSIGCKTAGFLSTLSTEVSTFYAFLITLDRYMVIKFPFKQYKISGKITLLLCTLAWTVGILIAAIPLLPWPELHAVYSSNGMCLALPLTNDRYDGWQFASIVFIFFNFILFDFILWGQLAIYRAISAMRMNESCLSNVRSRRVQDMTVAKNLSLVIITNFLCWCPIGIMGIMAMAGQDMGRDAYSWTAVIILPINSAINPFLYTLPTLWQTCQTWKNKLFMSKSETK